MMTRTDTSACLTFEVGAAHTQAARVLLEPYLLRDPDFDALESVGADNRRLSLHPRVMQVDQLEPEIRVQLADLGGTWGERGLGVLSEAQRVRLFTVVFYSKSKLQVPLRPGLPHSWRRVLSNFYEAELELEGARYASVEHVFQGRKASCSTRPEMAQWFEADHGGANAVGPDPAAAKKAGGRASYTRAGASLDTRAWEQQRVALMARALEARWAQQALFRAVLASTEGLALLHFERAGARSFWGGSLRRHDGLAQGENRLGHMLMALRARAELGAPS